MLCSSLKWIENPETKPLLFFCYLALIIILKLSEICFNSVKNIKLMVKKLILTFVVLLFVGSSIELEVNNVHNGYKFTIGGPAHISNEKIIVEPYVFKSFNEENY